MMKKRLPRHSSTGSREKMWLINKVKGVVARTRYILATGRNVVAEGQNPEVKVLVASAYWAQTDSAETQKSTLNFRRPMATRNRKEEKR